MQVNRRKLLAGAAGAGASALATGCAGGLQGPSPEELDRVAAAPVLKRDRLPSPVLIDSIRLLKKDREYLVHVRSKDGAEGVSLTNPPRADYLAPIFKHLIIPFFLGKDAREVLAHGPDPRRCLENLDAILRPEIDPDGALRLVAQMPPGDRDRQLSLLAAFCAGLFETSLSR